MLGRLNFTMKLQVVIILTIFLVAMSTATILAQGRQSRTGSAKAAYGFPSERYSTKKKSKKKKKKKQRKPPNKNASPLYRKRDPWVN